MKIVGIYKVTNMANGSFYIGSSNNIGRRIKQHLNGRGNRLVKHAIAEYGIKNFTWCVLEECPESQLVPYEQRWIDEMKPEYNMSSIAGKVEMTEEVRRKLSDAAKGNARAFGYIPTEEARQKIGLANKGNTYALGNRFTHTDEEKRKMSATHMGNTNALGGTGFLGHTHTEETRRKLSEVNKGKTPTEETRAKMSMAHIGKKHAYGHSEEACARISASLKTYWETRKGVIK